MTKHKVECGLSIDINENENSLEGTVYLRNWTIMNCKVGYYSAYYRSNNSNGAFTCRILFGNAVGPKTEYSGSKLLLNSTRFFSPCPSVTDIQTFYSSQKNQPNGVESAQAKTMVFSYYPSELDTSQSVSTPTSSLRIPIMKKVNEPVKSGNQLLAQELPNQGVGLVKEDLVVQSQQNINDEYTLQRRLNQGKKDNNFNSWRAKRCLAG